MGANAATFLCERFVDRQPVIDYGFDRQEAKRPVKGVPQMPLRAEIAGKRHNAPQEDADMRKTVYAADEAR